MLQANPGRSGKQQQERNSLNLGTALQLSPVNVSPHAGKGAERIRLVCGHPMYRCLPMLPTEEELEGEVVPPLSFGLARFSMELHLGCNSIDILRTALTRALTIGLSGAVLNPCLNLRPYSSLQLQMSIELHPWRSRGG